MTNDFRPLYVYEISVDPPEDGEPSEVYRVTAYTILDAARAYAERAGWAWTSRGSVVRGDALTWRCAPMWLRTAGLPWKRVVVQCTVESWCYLARPA
jgi:hypothetical protein